MRSRSRSHAPARSHGRPKPLVHVLALATLAVALLPACVPPEQEGGASGGWTEPRADIPRFATWTAELVDEVWSEPLLLDDGGGKSNFAPRLQLDADGNAIAVWSNEKDGALTNALETDVWSVRFDAATRDWEEPLLVGNLDAVEEEDRNAFRYVRNPEVEFDGAGNVVVVWSQTDDSVQLKKQLLYSWLRP